jgi:hypothetical protein
LMGLSMAATDSERARMFVTIEHIRDRPRIDTPGQEWGMKSGPHLRVEGPLMGNSCRTCRDPTSAARRRFRPFVAAADDPFIVAERRAVGYKRSATAARCRVMAARWSAALLPAMRR